MLERIAHAKINLALHITEQREDGYHLIDSLVVFAQFGDVISVREAPNASSLVDLKIDGPFLNNLEVGANNLVSRAALALGYQVAESHGKPKPVEITLTKNLPIASGIGGGSADAAATLIALQAFWQSDINLENIAMELGADIPMCLHSKPLQAKGIGDEIILLESKTPLNMVLVNPNVEVSTPEIFKRLENKNNPTISIEAISDFQNVTNLKALRNDLQKPALELEPIIQDVINALKKTKARLVRMSGSGATCFGLYETLEDAQKVVADLKSQNPNWWCIASATTVS